MLCIAITLFLISCCADHVTSRRVSESYITGIHILDGLCMPKRADRLVYRHRNSTHVYIAFDVLKTGKVDVFSWKIVKHEKGTFISHRVKIQTMPAIDFRKQVSRDHVIAATSRKHEDTFKHRVRRKMKHCKNLVKEKKKHCKVNSIISLFVRLRMRDTDFDGNCDNGIK